MTEVAKIEQVGQVQEYAGDLLEVISRAARDPNVDIDKMERLMQMHERITQRDAEVAFNQAMAAAQAEMGRVSTNAHNPQTKSRYADFAQLDRALRPIYTSHGFALSFDEGPCEKPDYVRVVCYVSHIAGFTRTYHRDMPADGKGAKGGDVMTKTHAAGAAGSYGARYLLRGIFNVAVGEDDRDGNTPQDKITPEQVAELEAAAIEVGADIPKFCAYAKIESLSDILAKDFNAALRTMKAKKRTA